MSPDHPRIYAHG